MATPYYERKEWKDAQRRSNDGNEFSMLEAANQSADEETKIRREGITSEEAVESGRRLGEEMTRIDPMEAYDRD